MEVLFRSQGGLYRARRLGQIEASFPANAGEGGMVGYYETLPFARPVSITAAEKEWVFDDQYLPQTRLPMPSSSFAVLSGILVREWRHAQGT